MINPVLRREAKTALRNCKVFYATALYVAFMAFVSGLYIWSRLLSSYSFGFNPQSIMEMYSILCGFQLGLILITTPALTAGSISLEREKQTLDLLLITKISPLSIIVGKLVSSLGLIFLMTVATLPIFAITFYFGGISLIDLLYVICYLFMVSCLIGSISIFLSCLLKKTVVSIVITYLIIILLCAGTAIGYTVFIEIYSGVYEAAPSIFTGLLFFILNPIVGFISVMDAQFGTTIAFDILYYSLNNSTLVSKILYLMTNNFWLINSIANCIVSGIFIFLSTKFIMPLKKIKK